MDNDDDFGDDADFAAALDVVERSSAGRNRPLEPSRPAPSTSTARAAQAQPKVQQPKPQALPSRQGPSSILVSPRQKGNSILNHVRAIPWEYSDIPADYVLGSTTCALFLSLKYHQIHPEYIYSRIKALGHKYNLRVLLTVVDISAHEESLKELSKTSLVNNLTLILCWSAQEAGRYLELYKTFEHSAPTAIRAHQATSYNERLVDFITTPRSINKSDALGLISNFGSLRAAINARPEEIAMIAGWGEKKVDRWCKAVREPFRVQKAAKRDITDGDSGLVQQPADARLRALDDPGEDNDDLGMGRSTRHGTSLGAGFDLYDPAADQEEAMLDALPDEPEGQTPRDQDSRKEDQLSEGVATALARLRENN